MIRRKVELSFALVVLVSFAALGVMGYVLRETRILASENRALIEETNDLRRQRAIDQAETDRMLCRRINAERDILADLIRNVIARSTDSRSRARAVELFADSLDRLKPSDCRNLPSQRPFEDPTESNG
jgi:hypothetical protein